MPTAKKTAKKRSSQSATSAKSESASMTPVMTPKTLPPLKLNRKLLTTSLIVLAIALLTYKYGPWMVPATVAGVPVTRFEIWGRLEQSYGTQTIDDLVNEKILDRAIAKSGVQVDQAKIDQQMDVLEKQFQELGGLDEALKQRGMTREDLEKQVRTQVAVEEILQDKITPTEAEIKSQFETNQATLYKDKKLEEVTDSIAEELKQTKLRDAFLVWFADAKKDIPVKTFGL